MPSGIRFQILESLPALPPAVTAYLYYHFFSSLSRVFAYLLKLFFLLPPLLGETGEKCGYVAGKGERALDKSGQTAVYLKHEQKREDNGIP